MGGRRITNVDAHVARRIRMLRLLRGMSQQKIAAELEITFQQVQKYEKGRDRISAGVLYHLAELLAVDVAFFFEGAERQSAGACNPAHPCTSSKTKKKRLRPR